GAGWGGGGGGGTGGGMDRGGAPPAGSRAPSSRPQTNDSRRAMIESASHGCWRGMKHGVLSSAQRDAYLGECRAAAVRYITEAIAARDRSHPAYRAVLDYPLREAKGLRPALAIATCRALGGGLAEVVPTAAAFELL